MTLLALLPLLLATPAIDEVSEQLVEELLGEAGETQEALIDELAEVGTADALDALFGVYHEVTSRYGRRAVLRALGRFDDSEELGHRAAEWLAEFARGESPGLLREAALDALGAAPKSGHAFLKWLVDTPGDDLLRLGAMQRLSEHAPEVGLKWFLERYLTAVSSEERAPMPPRVREVAFRTAILALGEQDLVQALADENREIRRDALEELDRRNSERIVRLALEMFENRQEEAANRAEAARILDRRERDEHNDTFLDEAEHHETSLALRQEVAEILREAVARADSTKLVKRLAKLAKSRHPFQRLFALEALDGSADPRAVKAVLGALEHKDANTSFRAMQIIADNGLADAEKDLRKLLKSSRDATLRGQAVRSLGAVLSGADLDADLAQWLASDDVRVRNAACEVAAAHGGAKWLDALALAIRSEDWTTRLAALRALEQLRTRDGLGPIIERMPEESGRMRREFAEALWRMTGQEFGRVASSWRKWYEAEGESIELVEPEELVRLDRERSTRELKRSSFAPGVPEPGAAAPVAAGAGVEPVFFDHAVDSRYVAFVLDASLSMERTLRSPYRGVADRTRYEAAREELFRTLDNLPEDSRFNVILFSTHIQPWREELVPADGKARESAREFVDEVTLGFGTDIWGGIEAALDLPGVDTIYLLSDGEPAGATVNDLRQIVLEFRRRNADLGVELNSVALGPELSLLRWLAEAGSGTYVRFP